MRAFNTVSFLVLVATATSCRAAPPVPPAPAAPFTLRGAVTDANTGRALTGVSVRVSRTRRHAGQPAFTMVTTGVDSLGQFAVTLSEGGRFYVTGVAIGYRPTTLRVDLPRDFARLLALRLLPDPIYLNRRP